MTTKQFKEKYPQYAHLEGNALWNMMEDVMLRTGDCWVADYSEGVTTLVDTDTLQINDPKYWVNEKTGERITSEEFGERMGRRGNWSHPVQSFRFDILDFGKTDEV